MKRPILCLLVCILCSMSQAAQIIQYVDPDAAGAGNGDDWTNAYTSLNAWNAGEANNLVTAGNYHTVYCRSSAGTDDTTAATIGTGWTTGAANYIEVIGSDFPADGIWDDTKYVFHNNDSAAIGLAIREEYVRINNIQILVTATSFNSRTGIDIGLISTSDIRISNCIFKGADSSAGTVYGLFINDPEANFKVWNCIFYDFVNGASATHYGIRANVQTLGNIYNCTISNCYQGIRHGSGTLNIINCAVFNNTDDFNLAAGAAADYCASDDGDGTNAQDFTAEATDWNKVFTDYANGDVSLKDYTTSPCCVGVGTDNPGSGLYNEDIIGTARSSTWDIGAFEYAAAPPAAGGGQVIIIEME